MNYRAFYSMLAGAVLTIFVSSAAFGDPHAELGVSKGASQEDIRSNYIRLLRVYHEGGSAPNPIKWKNINAAYQALQTSIPTQQFEMSEADRFRAFLKSRYEGSMKVRLRNGAMAQYFTMFYEGTGVFTDARVLLMVLGIEPQVLLVYEMGKELEKTSDELASQIQIAKGNFGQREFSRIFLNEDLPTGIVRLMESLERDIATLDGAPEWPKAKVEELRREFTTSVGEMFSNLGYGCHADMKNCLLRLLEGIEQREPLYDLIDLNNSKILLKLIDDVIQTENGSWLFSQEYWRLQHFRRKLIGLHKGTVQVHFQSCEAIVKDAFRIFRR